VSSFSPPCCLHNRPPVVHLSPVQVHNGPELPDTNSITLNTARISLIGYAVVVGLPLAGCRGRSWRNLLRPMRTIGCIAMMAHVMAAFHDTHHWSHADAIESAARESKQLIG
jgi:hypothetical protein